MQNTGPARTQVKVSGFPRRLAEAILGPLVVQRRLPPTSGAGRVMVSGRVGGLKFLLKPASRWDMPLLNVARALVKPGDVVWDIGANVGLFSRASSFHAGEKGYVLAVEADADAARLLLRTTAMMEVGHAEVSVLPVAIAGTCGVVKFDIAKRARAANAIHGFGSTQTGGVRESRLLPCLSLDSLLPHFPAPDVLKIDVEGAEVEVIAGGKHLLREYRPLIYCEVQNYTRSQVVQALVGHGYAVFDGDHHGAHGELLAVGDCTSNVVAFPDRDEKTGRTGAD